MATTYLRGEIDLANSGEVREQLQAAIRSTSSGKPLIVDCTALTFLDSSGIKVLCEIHEALHAHGRRLVLVHVSPFIRRTLDLVGVAETFGIPRAGGAGPDEIGRTDPAAASS